jgi:hypothetical protein
MLEIERRTWSEHVLTLATDRFEKRLVEETSGLRLEIAQLAATLRKEMALDRFELLKWMFVFWIGQLAAVSAVLSFMLRPFTGR